MNWQWCHFKDLTKEDLYAILRLRQAVFVVEQNCVYNDCDNDDLNCWHLMGWKKDSLQRDLAAYSRVLLPGTKYPEVSFGRIVVSQTVRGQGMGAELTKVTLKKIEETFGRVPVRISAQAYLEKFYSSFGFLPVGEKYLEDGIPHIEMILNWVQS